MQKCVMQCRVLPVSSSVSLTFFKSNKMQTRFEGHELLTDFQNEQFVDDSVHALAGTGQFSA